MSEKVDRSIEEKALRYGIDRREVAEEAESREKGGNPKEAEKSRRDTR